MTEESPDPKPGREPEPESKPEPKLDLKPGPGAPPHQPRHGSGVDRKTLESLVCPVTQKPLDYDRNASELISRAANLAFPIRDGIPIMLVDEARELE